LKDAESLTAYGCALLCCQLVCIGPYSMNTTIAFYFVTECSAVMYGYGSFAIGLDPKFFHKLHIQSVSKIKLWAPISNPKPPTQLHMSQNIW